MHIFKINKWLKFSLLGMTVLLSLTAYKLYDDDDDFELTKNLEIYYTLIRELNTYYVDKPDPGKLITDNINNMLNGLDPYTVYIPETKIEDYKAMSTGEYGGIGVSVIMRNKELYISSVFAGTPAQENGLMVGDKILEISDQVVKNLSMGQISALMKGSASSLIHLKISRFGHKNLLNFQLSREDIKIHNVPFFHMLTDKVGYIKLTGFTQTAAEEVTHAFSELKAKGMQYLLFDLRGNPGGLLIEAVKIVNLFVPKNTVVVNMIGRVKQWNHCFKTTSAPLDTAINIVVLVNSMSASAAEIVSGSLQDLDRAVIVGERSFGKGLVQTTRPLIYNSQLKLTTAKYYIPSGRCIQALDYSHRNQDGSVGKVPDSLISQFQTHNGRIVYDGGGIQPDVIINSVPQSLFMTQLQNKYILFDFVTEYIAKTNPNYTSLDDIFNDSEHLFNSFVKYAQNSGFKYVTKRETQLHKLIEIAKEEKSYNEIEPEIKNLQIKLEHKLEKDLIKFKNEITSMLITDLADRFFYSEGSINVGLRNDIYVKKSEELFLNSTEIDSILHK